jgi:hypothetical protein
VCAASQGGDFISEEAALSFEGDPPPSSAPPGRAQILKALREILRSSPFRTSRQCQDLLRYVVEHSIAGHDELLRERVIGSEVFGRPPDYDTANDPVVRARIAEVRKRLAQYYLHETETASGLRIEIPSGSYRARFETVAAPAPPVQMSQSEQEQLTPAPFPVAIEPAVIRLPPADVPGKKRLVWIMAAMLLLCIASGFTLWRTFSSSQERMLNLFWGPAFHSPMPVLVYTGTNVVYRFSPQFLDRYRQTRHMENAGPEFVVDLPSLKAVDPRDLSASANTYVSVGDVSACSAITSMLVRHGKTFEMRYAGDISAGDVHSASTVLIGAFNNNWTLDVTRSMRFAFVRGDTIEDRIDKRRSWSVHMMPDGTTLDDYAVISRVLLPKTGAILLTAAGIGQYGTQAASEYVVNPQEIAAFAAGAPADWPKKNVQIVLHVKVIDDAPGPVDVAAVYFW